VDGLLDGSLGFGGEESAAHLFCAVTARSGRRTKTNRPALLAAEITARMGRDPGEIYDELTREFGEPVYDLVEAPATRSRKKRWKDSHRNRFDSQIWPAKRSKLCLPVRRAMALPSVE